jgi:hypothetical protein
MVRIVAIEVEDPFTLGATMTPDVEAVVGAAADRVARLAVELCPAAGAAAAALAP